MPHKYDAIFFDLDGTLTDPKEGITGCIQYALECLGAPVPEQDELTWCIGPSLLESFAHLVSVEHAAQAVEHYRQRFSTVGLFENRLYPDIPSVLARLNEYDQPLYVASSKPLVFVDRILRHFQLDRYFQQTFGSGLDGSLTDKAELLAFAGSLTGHDLSQCLMVGDRSHDAAGAASQGMDFIGALYGYGSEDEYRRHGYTRWANQPKELSTLLDAA